MPKVSIILPVHNGATYIAEAVNSILAQSYKDYDLYVLDDGSTDRTVDILQAIKHANLNIVQNKTNLGLINTLNRGLALSENYEYVARMDADDICLPDRLKATISVLDKNPKIGVAGTSVTYFGDNLKNKDVILPEKNNSIVAALLCRNPIIHPSVIIRNKVLQETGLTYNQAFYKYEDYKLWIDLIGKCEFYNTPQVHFMYRRHSNNVTNTASYDLTDDLGMVNQILLAYAEALQIKLVASELYTISIIASTYRWQINTGIHLDTIYTDVNNIISKLADKQVDKIYLAELLWERVFIYLLKAKRYPDLAKLLLKLGLNINFKHILRIYNNWY